MSDHNHESGVQANCKGCDDAMTMKLNEVYTYSKASGYKVVTNLVGQALDAMEDR